MDFSNTVVILTSNAGASGITETKALGFAPESESDRMQSHVNAALRQTFRPELLNRIDEIITFRPLTEEDIRQITSLMLADLTKRIAALEIGIRFSEEVVAHLSREGTDAQYGARPLRRVLVRRVEDPFSEELLTGRIQPGDQVQVVWEDGVRFCREETSS